MVSLQYLAGFIDGEGSLSLARIPRSGGSPEYCVRISIANTNKRVLEDIQSEYGGTLASQGPRNPKWRQSYALIWTNAAAARILGKIVPMLRTKSKQAAALLDFAAHITKCPRRRDRYGYLTCLSEGDKGIREAFYKRLKVLNARGPLAGSRACNEPDDQDAWSGESERVHDEYLAGFIDAEGSVLITRTRVRRYGTVQYRARLALSNTHQQTLFQIRRDCGGLIYRQRPKNSLWKDAYQLVWTEGMIPQVLSRVMPHLRIKQRQAEFLLEFISHVKRTVQRQNQRGWISHPKEVTEFREYLYQQMKRLNARGIEASST